MAALDLRKHERREKWDLAGGGGRVGKGHQVHVRRLRPSVGGIAENGHARPQPQIVIADLGVMDLAGISQCRRLVDGVEILQPADIARRTGGIRSREKGVLREAATVAYSRRRASSALAVRGLSGHGRGRVSSSPGRALPA